MHKLLYRSCILFFTILVVLYGASSVTAQTADELRAKIAEGDAQVKALEAEIKAYQNEILKTSKDITSIGSAIKTIDTTIKKLDAERKLTESKIASTKLRTTQLSRDIATTSAKISDNHDALRDSIRFINESDDDTLVEIGLRNGSFSDTWQGAVSLLEFSDKIRDIVDIQQKTKASLESTKSSVEDQKRNLEIYTGQLADQKKIAASAKAEKATLLAQSKSKDSTYRKLMADRIAKRDAVDKELLQYEANLRVILDKSAFPGAQRGILDWPLTRVIIAQYFGNTAFSKTAAGSAVYNGAGHNGVDFDASIGTPVKASLGGVIKGVGDTDVTCKSASFGKWILIEHPNGLSTLYAHLSLQKVSEGQSVNSGDIIGYSGNTGYSTGPHLHFTVYATQGMQITSMQSRVPGCGVYRVPRAATNSYLDPMQYLPRL